MQGTLIFKERVRGEHGFIDIYNPHEPRITFVWHQKDEGRFFHHDPTTINCFRQEDGRVRLVLTLVNEETVLILPSLVQAAEACIAVEHAMVVTAEVALNAAVSSPGSIIGTDTSKFSWEMCQKEEGEFGDTYVYQLTLHEGGKKVTCPAFRQMGTSCNVCCEGLSFRPSRPDGSLIGTDALGPNDMDLKTAICVVIAMAKAATQAISTFYPSWVKV